MLAQQLGKGELDETRIASRMLRLDRDIDGATIVSDDSEQPVQSQHAAAVTVWFLVAVGVGRVVPAAEVQLGEIGELQRRNQPAAGRRTVDSTVMDADEHPVARQPHVALDPVRPVLEGPFIGRERVLGLVLGRAAVRHDPWAGAHTPHADTATGVEDGRNERVSLPILERGIWVEGAVIRRVCATAAIAALPLVAGLPAAHADLFLQAQTLATAVHVTVTQKPASSLITASLLDDAVSYASSEFDSGNTSEALAAPAFPGNLVVQGPQLLCSQLFSCPVDPPSYPLLADASYPRKSKDTATASGSPTGSGPFVVTPLSAHAVAASGGNEAATQAGGVEMLAGTAGAVNVGASTASTSVQSTNDGLEVTVTAFAHDIDIGGLVHIAGVRAVDSVTLSSGRAPVAKPQITVSGVTVSGHTASIDDKGLHVDGANGPGLSQQVDRHGISIRTVGATHHESKNGSRSDATALAIDVALPVNGVPYIPNPLPPLPPPFDQIPALPGVNANGVYVAHVTLGAVGAAAGYGTEPAFDLASTPTPAQSGSKGRTTTNAITAHPPVGGSGFASKLAGPPQSPPAVAASPPGVLRDFVDLLSKGDMESLYLVLAFGTLALFVGWRTAVALRPARRSTR